MHTKLVCKSNIDCTFIKGTFEDSVFFRPFFLSCLLFSPYIYMQVYVFVSYVY